MAEGAGSDMDSLFEGMDFVMPTELEDVTEPPADGSHNETLGQTGSATVIPTEVPAAAATALPTALPAAHSSSSSSLTSLPSVSRNMSGSLGPAGQLSPSAHGGLQRDPTKPLDESLFSGLNVSFMDEEGSLQDNFENFESQKFKSTVSSKGGVQHMGTGSSDGKPAAEKVGNAEKDRPTVESIITAYTTSTFKHSSPGHSLASKPVSSLTSSPSQKASIRRKKRSMKIGYGREEEEQEEMALLRKTAAQIKITGVATGKVIVNGIYDSSPRLSVSSYGFSRTSSQGQLDVEELSEGTSVAEESEVSAREVTGAEIADGELSSATKVLVRDSTEIVADPTVFSSVNEDTNQLKGSESQETRPSVDAQQTVPSSAHEVDRKSSDKKDEELQGSVIPNPSTAEEEELMTEKPPDDTVNETNRDNLGTTPSTAETAVTEEKDIQRVESPESSLSEQDDLDITMLAAKKVGSIEERLLHIGELVASALKDLQRKNSSASALRKAAVQERRQAAERVSAASTRYKDLEGELTAACEKEDFEKADSLSGSVAEAENAMQQATEDFKSAEAKCDLTSFKVQEILDLQVVTEEDAARLFESVKQEAEDAAERVRKESQEAARRDMERLTADEEAAEARRRKLALSRRVIEEANAELDKVIGEGTKAETELKTSLTEQRSCLLSELKDLLALVRKKEAEIADCDQRIEAVDEKMNTVIANFEIQRSSLDAESEALAASSLELDDVFKRIAAEKEGVNDLLGDGENEGLRLEKIARSAADAGGAVQDALKLKKAIASTASFYKHKNADLAEKEKTALEKAQALRQDSLSCRASLQELTTMKVKLNQEIAEKKQLMLFIEKRTPELDSEKKLAAAARNFKEAGRLAAEVKSLTAEKETATADMIRMSSKLRIAVESEAERLLGVLADMDNLIADEEKEAAIARCERLRLLAAAARMEGDAAIEVEDFEEAESLDTEAEAADLEADDLQRVYQLEGGQYEKQSNSLLGQADNSSLQTGGTQVTKGVESQVERTDCPKVDNVEVDSGSKVG